MPSINAINKIIINLEDSLCDEVDNGGVLLEVSAEEGRVGESVECTHLHSVTLLTLFSNQEQIMTPRFKT